MKKTAFISLGPTCVPAEILKSSGLRSCTYGFDWFRSGGYFVEKLLATNLDDFLYYYVYNPSIQVRQPYSPSEVPLKTVELETINPVYGFPYLYNPHRSLYDNESKAYFARAFGRLKLILRNNNVYKDFLVADYVNKNGATFLTDDSHVLQFLKQLFCSYDITNFRVTLLRLRLSNHTNLPPTTKSQMFSLSENMHTNSLQDSPSTRSLICDFSSCLDDENVRRLTYKLVGKVVYGNASQFSII